ncbi:hypothetical protein LUZ60_011018 [Juncus effusus]|nr:hypothetical protein LUZ60_011018 [Juncus effusus]
MAGRGEVDTSSQFESVKAAVNRFGGGGGAVVTWQRPDAPEFQLRPEEIELMKVEEQTVKLEMELFVRERETFKVLKELESTKQRINTLNSELERESKCMSIKPLALQMNEEKMPVFLNFYKEILAQNSKRSPNSTLVELQQAKANLNRNRIEILKAKIEEEKLLMEKTHENIRLKNDKAASLEKDLNKISMEIQNKRSRTQSGIQAQIKEITTQKEKHKKMGENYKSEISQLISQIEHTKSKTKIIEVRYYMAKKMKEASNSAEQLAHSKLKILNPNSNSNSEITLSAEDHAELIYKAQEADKISQNKIETAVKEVENANKSKNELLERVEEAMIDVQTSRKALNAALKREEIANQHKLEAEEALRRWRSNYHNTPHNNNHKKIVHNSTKFKNSVLPPKKGGNNLLDVNGLSLVKSKSNLSIGQILNIKLMEPQERERKSIKVKSSTKPKVSLGQILSQSYEGFSPLKIDDGTCQSKLPSKKKKLGFVVLTLLMAKQRRKKRKQGFVPQSKFSSSKTV